MKREHRYFVLKLTDADRWLTATERLILAAIGEKVEAHRFNTGKAPLECVVVERDWPEYEPTWKAIEARVDAQPNAIELTGTRLRVSERGTSDVE